MHVVAVDELMELKLYH